MPCFANHSPSVRGSDAEPAAKPPPWKTTSTGRFSPAARAVVHTFRYRQSSPMPASRETSGSPNIVPCMQRVPQVSALRVPVQGATGWGAFQRSGPTGGAAKGTPRKTRTDGSVPTVPSSVPPVTFTRSAADSAVAESSAAAVQAVRGIMARSLSLTVIVHASAARREPAALRGA